jgi:replicative DNA helicase
MPRDQVAARIACAESGVDVASYRRRALTPEDTRALVEGMSWLASRPVAIDDRPAVTLMQVRGRCRRLARRWEREGTKLSLVIVDYLQLMGGKMQKGGTREQLVAENSRGLTALA